MSILKISHVKTRANSRWSEIKMEIRIKTCEYDIRKTIIKKKEIKNENMFSG